MGSGETEGGAAVPGVMPGIPNVASEESRGAAERRGSKEELRLSDPNHWRNFDLLLLLLSFSIYLFCAVQRPPFSKIMRNFNRPLISVSHELRAMLTGF